MTGPVLEAVFYLLRTELLMRRHGVSALSVELKGLHSLPESRCRYTSQQICRAVDSACVFYLKRVLCLQRSAATTMLLRRYGFPAQLVIGARILPFKSHAWVELDKLVINDKSYTREIYRELQRC